MDNYKYICFKKYFHKNIHILLFNIYFYKNKESKLGFGYRIATLNYFLFEYEESMCYVGVHVYGDTWLLSNSDFARINMHMATHIFLRI